MNKQDDKKRVMPKMRFPEFQMELGWRKDNLGNLFTERKEKGYQNLPLLSLTEQNGIIPQAETNRKNNSSLDKSKYLRVYYGDIAYNTMRMWEGRSAFVNMEGIVSPAYTICTPKNNINSFFYSYYFKLPNLISEFHRYSQGLVKDTLNLKFDKFAQISVGVPPKSEEQQKIADCLSSIDELINFREQKLAALKQHKKGLMQQLFPSHNNLQASKQASKQAIVYPKFRFPQFKDCKGWEVVELMNIGYFVKEKIEVLNLNPKDYISTENLLSDYGGVTISNKLPTTEKVTAFQKNDILISNIRPYLKKVWVADKDGGASNDIIVIRAKSNINTSFLSSVIKNDDFINYMMKGAKGLKMPRGDLGLISIFPVAVPSDPKEQQAIADCLSSLDKLISEENEQIGRLKDHKKGLMQQLFPIFRN